MNKNLQSRNTRLNVSRNFESQRDNFDKRSIPSNKNNNINNPKEKQTYLPRTYAGTLNNNTSTTLNDEISDFNGLISEINKLKQLINIPHMISVIRNLNNRIINSKDGMEKLQAFIEVAELIDRNG